MDIRESLNKNKNLGVGIGAAILIVAVGLIAFQLRGGGGGMGYANSAFYTDDNGKTFFKDNAYKVSPFDHGGEQAYRADVFKCPDGKQFVGVIYRHNALGRKGMEEHIAKGSDDPMGTFLSGIERQGTEIKPIGAPDSAWTLNADETAADALRRSVKCPSGGSAQLVLP